MAFRTFAAALMTATFLTGAAQAANLAIVTGVTGDDIKFLQAELDAFQKQTGDKVTITPMPSSTTDQFGQYRLWLAAGNSDIDVYMTDVIWAPQLAEQFVDLTKAAGATVKDHFPGIVASQTVNGKLVAMPYFTDAPALYYRKDLLDKYKLQPPKTWAELASDAKTVLDGERATNKDLWGFVFQGSAYEGLTCDALEWIKSNNGGQIVEPDGKISVNNKNAAAALDAAKSWIGTVSPPGVLAYQEEESRGIWQLGNSVFMRNWPYAFALGNGADSKIKGLFDVVPLPAGSAEGAASAATLGGWNMAVSKYSKNVDEATKLVLFLTSKETQKANALQNTHLPTIPALYDDPDIAAKQPVLVKWKEIFVHAIGRPSGATKLKYNEVSSDFWNAVHDTLSGNGSGADNLAKLEEKLADLKGDGW